MRRLWRQRSHLYNRRLIMAEIICCGSSSSGNGYILSCGGEHLIIELGVNFDEYRKILNDKGGLMSVRGCLTSHL